MSKPTEPSLRKLLLEVLLGIALLLACFALGYLIAWALAIAEAIFEIAVMAFAIILYVVLLSLLRPGDPHCRY